MITGNVRPNPALVDCLPIFFNFVCQLLTTQDCLFSIRGLQVPAYMTYIFVSSK